MIRPRTAANIVVAVTLLMTACTPGPTPPDRTHFPETPRATMSPRHTPGCTDDCALSPSPSPLPTATYGNQSLPDVKEALAAGATLEELEDAYGLEVVAGGAWARSAANPSTPDLRYGFEEDAAKPGVFRLVGMSGPASFILPEYVGKRLDDIPTVTWREPDDSWVYLKDGDFFYNARLDKTPGVLAPDAIVGIGFED